MKCAGQDSGICEDEARGKALREHLEKTSRKTMTTPNTPNAAERPSELLSAETIAAMRKQYAASQIPPCRVCGGPLSIASCGGGNATVYACSMQEADPDRPGWFRLKSDRGENEFGKGGHYSDSQWTDYHGGGDSRVIALLDHYANALDSHHPAESVSADHPECSGDPACCPENEGFGCCKPNPQPSTPGAVSDEDVKQWGYALERAIESQRLLAEGIDKDNPEDPWASLLVHEDVAQLGNLATALESFAKRSAAPKGDEAVAVDFYSRNPSAALVDFTNRVAPPAQAVSVPVHEVIVRESLIREAHQKICNWIGAVAINGSHSGAAYSSCKEVVTKLASNLSDEARETLKMIDALRSDEADSVTILCDNQEFNGQPNCAIEVCGAWTNFEPRRFAANTLQLCLMGAVDAKRIYAAPAAATREGKE